MDFASYISGLFDGEGCFSVSFNFREKLKLKIEVRPSFSISQNKRNLSILKEVKDFFKCGSIRFSKKDQTYKYETRSISDLNRKIIPHFEKFPLKTTKARDFKKFSEICALIFTMKHRNKEHLENIIEKAYAMNESGKRKYSKAKLLSVLGVQQK